MRPVDAGRRPASLIVQVALSLDVRTRPCRQRGQAPRRSVARYRTDRRPDCRIEGAAQVHVPGVSFEQMAGAGGRDEGVAVGQPSGGRPGIACRNCWRRCPPGSAIPANLLNRLCSDLILDRRGRGSPWAAPNHCRRPDNSRCPGKSRNATPRVNVDPVIVEHLGHAPAAIGARIFRTAPYHPLECKPHP